MDITAQRIGQVIQLIIMKTQQRHNGYSLLPYSAEIHLAQHTKAVMAEEATDFEVYSQDLVPHQACQVPSENPLHRQYAISVSTRQT
jgi:hypothetical protein